MSILPVLWLAAGCGSGGGGGAEPDDAGQAAPPQISLGANPTSVSSGGTSDLTWSSQNATSCTASDGWSGSRATSGSYRTPALTNTTTFTLSCSGAGGGALARVTVTVAAANAPGVQLSASPGGVGPGEQTTLTWTGRNVTSCTASGGWTGNRPEQGTEVVGPLTVDTTYSLNCTGPGGSAVAMTTVSYRVARLSWNAPTQNADGTPLTDLAGYRVHWGAARRSYSQSAAVNGASNTSYDVLLTPGTWYFAVTARNSGGLESGFSGEVSKTVN